MCGCGWPSVFAALGVGMGACCWRGRHGAVGRLWRHGFGMGAVVDGGLAALVLRVPCVCAGFRISGGFWIPGHRSVLAVGGRWQWWRGACVSGFALGQRRCGGCLGGVAGCGFACWSVLGLGCSGGSGLSVVWRGPVCVGWWGVAGGLEPRADGGAVPGWCCWVGLHVGCVCARCAADLVGALQVLQRVMRKLVMPMVRVPLVMQRVMVTLVMPMARVL